ncbi:MAG TPA: hypothetical protein VGM41_19485 [Chitinophagaceae bacterium]
MKGKISNSCYPTITSPVYMLPVAGLPVEAGWAGPRDPRIPGKPQDAKWDLCYSVKV